MKQGPSPWPPEPQQPQPENEGRSAELELTHDAFLELRNDILAAGGKEFPDTSSMSKALHAEQLVVRREHPDAVIAAIKNHKSFSVEPFANGVRYANCALWDTHSPAGLNNAFLEGYSAKHNVVAVIGFAPESGMDIQELAESASTFAGMDRAKVRSFAGAIQPHQIRFVLLRTPLEAMREQEMTPEEIERYDEALEKRLAGKRAPAFAFRGYVFEETMQ